MPVLLLMGLSFWMRMSMTNIYSNGLFLDTKDILHVSNVSYTFLNAKIYSTTIVDRLYGVFTSDIVQASSAFIKWNRISWSGTNSSHTKVYLFVRAANSAFGLEQSPWTGPYQNNSNDISALKQPYLQFMVVLRNDAYTLLNLPIVNWVNISFFSSQTEVKFFTKSFDLGFTPKHVLLTYNGSNITDEAIIRFAVSGDDTIDPTRYQYIEPNKFETLNEISYGATSLKVMLEIVGNSLIPVSVDEFALMFSGNGNYLANTIVVGGHGIGEGVIGSTFVVGG